MMEREKRIRKKKVRFLPPSCGFDYLIPKQPQENETTPRPPRNCQNMQCMRTDDNNNGCRTAARLPACRHRESERERERLRVIHSKTRAIAIRPLVRDCGWIAIGLQSLLHPPDVTATTATALYGRVIHGRCEYRAVRNLPALLPAGIQV